MAQTKMEGEEKEYQILVKSIETDAHTEHKLRTIEGRDRSNGHILWTIEFDFFNKVLRSNPDYMLSNALNEIREEIEPKGFRIGVRWAEIDAHQSGMLGDMSAGSLMYLGREVDEINNKANHIGGYPSYHILEATSIEKAVTLDVQKKYLVEWRKEYRKGLKPKRNWIQRLLGK